MEIVSLQIGACGNNIATEFWETISQEHGILPSGLLKENESSVSQNLAVYFSEITPKRYAPRTVLVDLDTEALDSAKTSTYGQLYKAENCISGTCGTSRNWAKGRYTDGNSISELCLEAVRREVEGCEKFLGFQLTHSIGGGTGGGLGSLLIQRIKENYSENVISTYCVVPSNSVDLNPVEFYNSAFSIHNSVEYADLVTLYENEALFNLSRRTEQTPTIKHLNRIIREAMNGATASFRYPSLLNSDLVKSIVSFVPFPRIKFLTPVFAPINFDSHKLSTRELVESAFNPSNALVTADYSDERIFVATASFRGSANSSEAFDLTKSQSEPLHICEWISDNLKSEVLEAPQIGYNQSLTLTMNVSSIKQLFKKIGSEFTTLFREKKYIHPYLEEGMDEMEFIEAESNVNDLVSEYTPCWCGAEEEEEGEYEED